MEKAIFQGDKSDLKILIQLAKRMGVKSRIVEDEELEDLNLGKLIKKAKTGKKVAKSTVLKALKK